MFSLLVICCLRTLWLFFLFVSAPRCLDAAVDLQWQVNGNSIRVLDQVGDHGSGLTTTEGSSGPRACTHKSGLLANVRFAPRSRHSSALEYVCLVPKADAGPIWVTFPAIPGGLTWRSAVHALGGSTRAVPTQLRVNLPVVLGRISEKTSAKSQVLRDQISGVQDPPHPSRERCDR